MARMTRRVAMAEAKVWDLRVFEDASGAPALVDVAGFTFALDTLGQHNVTCTVLNYGTGAYMRDAPAAAKKARAAYAVARDQVIATDWLARNAAMYRD